MSEVNVLLGSSCLLVKKSGLTGLVSFFLCVPVSQPQVGSQRGVTGLRGKGSWPSWHVCSLNSPRHLSEHFVLVFDAVSTPPVEDSSPLWVMVTNYGWNKPPETSGMRRKREGLT